MMNTGISYTQYRSMIDGLLAEGKTTGTNHSESMIEYTKLNVHRMSKWDKIITLDPALLEQIHALDRKLVFITFTEGWCGDAAHNVPIVEKIATASPHIEHRLLLRDEEKEAFQPYWYKGTLSIPITVVFDKATGEQLATWGPRPAEAQHMVESNKETKALSGEELKTQLHAWYAKDKSVSMQQEWVSLFKNVLAKTAVLAS